MGKRTKRIYYGPPGAETSLYWTVRVKDATQPVTVNGNAAHALRAYAGTTIGCGLSRMAFDPANAEAFPHEVFLASFSKTAAWLVDKLHPNGSPARAIRYEHSYAWIVDANDTRTLKRLVRESPEIMERPFTLRVPRNQLGNGHGGTWSNEENRTPTGQKPRAAVFTHRGALARAVKAGRISKAAAQQLGDVASAVR